MRLTRRQPPAPIREQLTLERGERTLSAAPTHGGSYVVATSTALHLPTPTGTFLRLPWERVDQATWKDGWLHVHETYGGQVHHIRLDDPGNVPETVRERVTATVVISQNAKLPNGMTVRIAGRRPATGGEVRWTFVFPPDQDPSDPGLRAQAEQLLETLRRQTGL